MRLWLRNLLFTIVVPGSGGVLIPWWILAQSQETLDPAAWYAVAVSVLGAALYFWCLWAFASVGRGTPGPWDPPRRFVAAGPYHWIRNPMYISALLVVVGEAWLFRSLPLLVYAGAAAIFFHLFVIGYEEVALGRRFGETYSEYGGPSRAGSPGRRGAVPCRNVPWQTSENYSSSTFGEYAKRTAPWEAARPTRCSAGQFYGSSLPLHTRSLLIPPARPAPIGPAK